MAQSEADNDFIPVDLWKPFHLPPPPHFINANVFGL